MEQKKRHIKLYLAVVVLIVEIIISTSPYFQCDVYAKDSTIGIGGELYDLDEKSKYEYDGGTASSTISTVGSQFGTFTISGDVKSISAVNGYEAFEVDKGKVKFNYIPNGIVINAAENSWHLIEDKTNEVKGNKLDEKLGSKILCGALIIQSSNNGVSWITDATFTNIAGKDTTYNSNFYETKEIQQINGCYYRVFVVYELVQRIQDKKDIFGNPQPNYDYKKCVESYEFYIKDNSDAVLAAGAHPNTKKVWEDKSIVTNTGLDNGYSGTNVITAKDPHYGWSLGTFTLKGFTNTADYQGEEYYLKNLGDAITLSFKLEQNIEKLNNNGKLSIASDKDGSDQYFQIPKTDFKYGTLIIRHTDFQGKKTEPQIYIDFLRANARTGADTRVQLFEEGDYEVALDYEIRNSEGLGSYTNYRTFFTFKIRNGNNMVYAFDIGTKSQLTDGALTTKGFTIDTANSHYLTVTVNKYALITGAGGRRSLDLSWSRTASDGNTYKEEGIYEVTVSNKYQPNGDVTKTFYIGTDPYIKAMALTGKTLDDINNKVYEENYTIATDGTLISPTPKPTEMPEPIESEIQPSEEVEEIIIESTPTPTTTPTPAPTITQIAEPTKEEIVTELPDKQLSDVEEETDKNDKKESNPALAIVFIAVAASAVGVFLAKRKKNVTEIDKSEDKS